MYFLKKPNKKKKLLSSQAQNKENFCTSLEKKRETSIDETR